MTDAFERFGLVLNDRVAKTPVAIASMAGIVDADYVLARKDHIGAAFIGGYSLDPPTLAAARPLPAHPDAPGLNPELAPGKRSACQFWCGRESSQNPDRE